VNAEKREEISARLLPALYPVVRVHPQTGERILSVNDTFTTRIMDIPQEERDQLLRLLCDCIKVPEYHVRFRWSLNAVAIWENRSAQHYAMGDYWPAERQVERVTVAGDIVTR
jgi:taurine dioxygenase